MYTVTIKREALKDLKLLPKRVVTPIGAAIDDLAEEPRPAGCKKLKGSRENYWRIRIGDYRVIYQVDDMVRIVNVQKVGHRGDVYE